jgi:hypothetical protein
MNRDPIVSLTGPSSEEEGHAHLLVYRLASRIEIVVTEEHGADSSVLLSEDQARELISALTAAVDRGPSR